MQRSSLKTALILNKHPVAEIDESQPHADAAKVKPQRFFVCACALVCVLSAKSPAVLLHAFIRFANELPFLFGQMYTYTCTGSDPSMCILCATVHLSRKKRCSAPKQNRVLYHRGSPVFCWSFHRLFCKALSEMAHYWIRGVFSVIVACVCRNGGNPSFIYSIWLLKNARIPVCWNKQLKDCSCWPGDILVSTALLGMFYKALFRPSACLLSQKSGTDHNFLPPFLL